MKRLAYIDLLKGFTIYLVVLSHILQHYYSDYSYSVRLISSFFMPLFMFMSGYVCFQKKDWGLIKSRTVQLIVPFFSYIPISYLFYGFTNGYYGSFINYLYNIILYPDRGLWFLWALFFISILHIASVKISEFLKVSEYWIYGIIAIILNGIEYIFQIRLFGYHWIAWYFIYYVIGIIWRINDEKQNYSEKIYKRSMPYILVIFFCMSIFYKMHNEPPSFYYLINLGSLFTIFYRLIIGFMGIASCLCIFRIFERKIQKIIILTRWSKVTLGIYYWHFMILSILFKIEIPESAIHILIFVLLYSLFATWIGGKLADVSLRYKITSLIVMGSTIKKF